MNKLAIPAILAATILVTGFFAFSPVEKASTVHTTVTDTLLSASLVRVETALDFATGGNDFTGEVIYSLIADAEGVFEIEKLFLCDYLGQRFGTDSRITYTAETSITATGASGNLIDEDGNPFSVAFNFSTGDACIDLLAVENEDYHLLLGGDENNDIILHLEAGGLNDAENDGGSLVAYIVGLEDEDDIDVSCETAIC